MTTREENIKKINAELETLTDEQLEQIAGGTFTSNKFDYDVYDACGIKVIGHIFKKDEFWYKGKDIGHNDANAVVAYVGRYQKHPENLEQARKYYKDYNIETGKGEFLCKKSS